MAKVLISGYYGFDNLGDEALLSGLLSGLRDKHEIVVLSANPDATKKLHGVKAVHRYKSLFSALLNCDAVLSGGGGLLQNKTSNRSLLYYLFILRVAKLLGKQCFVFGQSIGPLNEQGRKWLKASLKGVSVAVRDKSSQELLASLGIQSECFADCALLLNLHPLDPLHPLHHVISSNKQKPIMLIPRGGYPEMETALLSIARQLKNSGEEVVALRIQEDEDQATIEKLKEIIPTVEVSKVTTPNEVISAIQKSRLVISIRLHGLILSAVAKVPYMGIVYDPKVSAFLSESEAVEITLPVNTDIDLDQQLNTKAIDVLQQRAHDGIAWLNEHLENR